MGKFKGVIIRKAWILRNGDFFLLGSIARNKKELIEIFNENPAYTEKKVTFRDLAKLGYEPVQVQGYIHEYFKPEKEKAGKQLQLFGEE